MKKQKNGEEKKSVMFQLWELMLSLVKLTVVNNSKSLHGDAKLSKRLLPLQSSKTIGPSCLLGTEVDIQNPLSTFVSYDKHVLLCSAGWTSAGVVIPGLSVISRMRFQENDCPLWYYHYYISIMYIQICINVSIQKHSSFPEPLQLY